MNRVACFESYDIRSNRWQRLADLPLPVHHTAVATVGGKNLCSGRRDRNFNAHQPRLCL